MKPQMNTDEHESTDLTFSVNGCAMSVMNALGHGFNEKLYENALVVELQSKNIKVEQQKHFEVRYKSVAVGSFVPDLIVNDTLVIELKTIDKITDNERGQVLNYLRVSGLKLGLILNFKNPRLEWARVIL